MPEEQALQLLLSEFNPRCQPPWTEQELRHKVHQASEKGQSPELLAVPKPNGKHATPPPMLPAQPKPEATSQVYAAIESKPVQWLWPNWIPLGKLTMLDGDPGLGKSTMLLDLAARVSTIGVMPDGSHGAIGNVAIMSAEDSPEDTIRPRLEAAGANLSRIHNLSGVNEEGKERPLEIPGDLDLVAKKLNEINASLLLIDPLMAFLTDTDANKDQSIRRVLFQLSQIIEKIPCAAIAMRHLNKGSGTKAIYRGNSSIGVIGHARAGLLVAADPDDDNMRVLAVTKSNLAAKPKSLRFQLVPQNDICKIGWAGVCEFQADDLLAQPPTAEQKEQKDEQFNKVEQAKAILTALLAEGQVQIKFAKAECADAGLSARAVERAAKQLNLQTKKIQAEDGAFQWHWLPSTESDGDLETWPQTQPAQ